MDVQVIQLGVVLILQSHRPNPPIHHHLVSYAHQLPHQPATPSAGPPVYMPAACELTAFADRCPSLCDHQIASQVIVAATLTAVDHTQYLQSLHYHGRFDLVLLGPTWPFPFAMLYKTQQRLSVIVPAWPLHYLVLHPHPCLTDLHMKVWQVAQRPLFSHGFGAFHGLPPSLHLSVMCGCQHQPANVCMRTIERCGLYT